MILAAAHAEARSVLRDLTEERERLLSAVARIQALLRTELGAVSEKPAAGLQAGEPSGQQVGRPIHTKGPG